MQFYCSGEFLENYPANREKIRETKFSTVNVSFSVVFCVGIKIFISINIVDIVNF
jgi:hypothetical protein